MWSELVSLMADLEPALAWALRDKIIQTGRVGTQSAFKVCTYTWTHKWLHHVKCPPVVKAWAKVV